jgi:hypothetical protein
MNTGRVHEITLKESRARADDTIPGMEEAIPFFDQPGGASPLLGCVCLAVPLPTRSF